MHAESIDLSDHFEAWAGLPRGSMADWEMVPYMVGDEVAAVSAVKGTEIHFATAPEWSRRIISRRRIAEHLGPLLARRGWLTTRVHTASSDDEFISRLGFELTRTDDGIGYYILWSLPFKRKTKE